MGIGCGMMVRRVFVDSWAWIALADDADPQHRRALEVQSRLQEAGVQLITTNVVVYEAVENLRRRFGLPVALSFRRHVELISTKPETLKIVYVTWHDEEEACAIADRYGDQDLFVVDCLSFAVMRALSWDTAFTGDWHFTLLGFQIVPN